MPSGRTNSTTVVNSVDMLPTFCSLAGLPVPDASLDGVNMSAAFRGEQPTRTQPLFWEYGRDPSYLRPGLESDRSPALAVRDGDWKLLMNTDGGEVELYDFSDGFDERRDLAEQRPETASRLRESLLRWWRSIPQPR